MKITIEMLMKKRACQEGLEWFKKNFPTLEVDHLEILQRLEDQKTTTSYGRWLLEGFKLTGPYRVWCVNGRLWEEAFYKAGELEGVRQRHSNGQLFEEAFYKAGELEGQYRAWYFNGQLWEEAFYKAGELEGQYRAWHSNGQLGIEGFYKNGLREGQYTEWHSNGQLRVDCFYKEGKEVK